MDTACPPHFDKLKLTVLTVQICSRPQKQIYGLDRRKKAFSISDTPNRIPHHKGVFYWKTGIFPRS